MLEVQNVHKAFNAGTINEKKALCGVNLSLEDGDVATVIGGNGAGKSTLLNAVAGVWPIDSGKILIDGVDVTRLPEFRRASYIGRVFQDPMMGTAASMWIEENMALAMRRGQKRTLRPGITNAEREKYREMLASLGLGLENRMTSKVGADAAHGLDEKAQAAAARRAHRRARPQNGCQGARHYRPHRGEGSPDHADDYP